MRAGEITPKKLVVFDIDDTLVNTQTKVHVIKDSQIVNSLNSHDFTHYKLKPGESFDFEDFRNAREFFEKSRPIIPMMNQLKRDISTGNKVVMVTARADFDDKELFLDTFRKYGVDIDKVHVYRAGNSKQGTTEERKKAIIKNLLDKDDYTKAIMYDDARPNLHTFIELKQDHPKTRFYAWHVSPDGEASEYMRENVISEKKKRKRKSRWAAYGPGPYGGYGFATGYSGDGGSSGGDGGGGGAVGEEIDEGWKDTLAGLALGAGVAFGGTGDVEAHTVKQGDTVYSIAKSQGVDVNNLAKVNKLDKNFTIKPGEKLIIPGKDKKAVDAKKPEKKKIDTSKTMTGTIHEAVLTRTARAAGITNTTELAAFLAQCAHESHDFKSMVEYGGSLDFRKYDPKYAPRKARALGNTQAGDGARYKGRGYIQLTGRYNYKRAGEALGLPLEDKPELAEKPEVAAKIAVWFWQQRVQPRVDNFNDVRAVTKPINPGLNGLQDRKEAFKDFKNFRLAQR